MQNQPTPDQDVGLVKTARLPPVDEPITDRIRQDFLKPRMFVPQHMVAQCRPVLVPVHSDDPALEGYPNIELKGEHARFVVPPVEDFSVNREDRVVYPKEDNLSVNEDKRENREKRETDDPQDDPNNSGLFGDYIRSFSLRHKNKNMSDEEALAVTYPLYHIDKRYSDNSPSSARKTKSKRAGGGKRPGKKYAKRSRKYRKLVT